MTARSFGDSDERRALLRELLASEGIGGDAATGIAAGPPSAPAPLSYPQQQLWLFERTFPGTPLYNVPAAVRLRGDLDRDALESAVDGVLRRHTVLRATFATEAGAGVQRSTPHVRRPLVFVDATRFPEDARDERVAARVLDEIGTPFDLAAGPLLRTLLIRLAPGEHLFVVTMHHIVGDAWSADVLVSEIAARYRDGDAVRLPELPVQYGDFARWQCEQVDGGALAGQIAYWRERLAGAGEPLELPADHPRRDLPRFTGSVVRFRWDEALSTKLRELSRSEQASPFMTCLALLDVLQHRYTGREDIVTGVAVAGRGRAEVENLVGFFVNTLPIRVGLRSRQSFRAVLRATRQAVSEGLANQDVPFETLVAELNPQRDLASSPFFRTILSFRAAPAQADMPGLTMEPVEVHNGTAKRDLTLHLIDHGTHLDGVLEYDTDVFDQATVTRLAGHLTTLAESVTADPDAAVGFVPMLTGGELEMLRSRNDTTVHFEQSRSCLHELFAEQAARTPDAVAVVHEGRRLTFAELDRLANRTAHLLRGKGIGPESVTGISMPRSLPMMVALLGVLKAGAAYVPLDPRDPAARRDATLVDAGARLVLVTEPDAELTTETIVLDDTWRALDGLPAEAPEAGATPANTAYVLYTSGSTGKPKGVMVEHAQMVNHVYALMYRLGIDEPLRYGMVQPLAVDSVVSMFGPPLCTGGELHLIGHERALDAAWLACYVTEHALHVLKMAPSHLKALQRSPAFPRMLPSRHLIVGGEASDRQWLQDVQARAECTIYNHYGHTETAVGMMVLAVGEHADPDSAAIAIGPPIANTEAYILDRNLQPVPVGVPGELCVGGVAPARGYLGRPGLTAAAFVPNPFSAEPGRRLYRSGDIMRWRPDGTAEFLGRRDDQVKIRGFRVELGEIDSLLRNRDDVVDAITLAVPDGPHERRVVSYVVPKDPATFSTAEITGELGRWLPAHMVPSTVMVLDALPMSSHGKIERSALPSPVADRTDPAAELPATDLERLVAGAWQQVLSVDKVGLEANFFDLGGHSFLVMQLHEVLKESLGRDFDLIELFQHTTVREQARFFAGTGDTGAVERGRERGRRQSEQRRRRRPAARRGEGIDHG